VTQYLEFKEFLGDSIGLMGVNSKYWVTAGFIGILLMIWPLKNRPSLG
jgi:hypothetical protein